MAPKVDRSLWRIAELSARCADPSWPGDKERAWSALQEAIAEVRGLVMETAAAIEAAERRAARAEGRIRVVRRERDRERAAHQALRSAAEAARETARTAGEKASASQARADEAQAALETAIGAREAAEAALRLALERSDDATAAQARAEAERDEVQAAYAALQEAREAAEADRAQAQSAVEAAEAAGEQLELTLVVGEPQPSVTEISTRAEAMTEAVSGGVERYLHVGATMGHLLPDDFGDLLVDGATLVRREGRLAVLISIPEESEWAAPSARAEEQAERLAAEGFRVQWVREISLAS